MLKFIDIRKLITMRFRPSTIEGPSAGDDVCDEDSRFRHEKSVIKMISKTATKAILRPTIPVVDTKILDWQNL